MKVVILAGGFGTRLGELTGDIPKPMVQVGGRPILWHIMKHYSSFGFNEFVLALGYKSEVIKNYFLNYGALNSDVTVDIKSGEIEWHARPDCDWRITMVDTGYTTMTGGRVHRLKKHLDGGPFMLTYGDGLSNVNISKLLEFHKKNKKMVTVTAVRPSARFGELDISNSIVESFQEKPQTKHGWINGGFFVIESEFIDLLSGDETVLESHPLEKAAASGSLAAYQHNGFWQCMDTLRDKLLLEELWKNGSAPWKIW